MSSEDVVGLGGCLNVAEYWGKGKQVYKHLLNCSRLVLGQCNEEVVAHMQWEVPSY